MNKDRKNLKEKGNRLPIRLALEAEFMDERIESGYTIKSEIKELWAVQLDLLNELLEFCNKEKIKVFAAYGTLIGAVRHKGFIPWDDDIDVMMLREDYDRFCKVANFESPYFLQREETDIGFSRAFARLRNSETTCIQTYEKDMNLTYNQGVFIDIFPIDFMPENVEERKAYGKQMRILRDKALKYSTFTFSVNVTNDGNIIKNLIKRVTSQICTPVLKTLKIKNPYIIKMERKAKKYQNTKIVGDYWWYEPDKDLHCWDIKNFDEVLYEYFESLKIPIPAGYDEVLEASFGNWRIPVMENTAHGSLIFDCHMSFGEYMKSKNIITE